MARSDEGKTRLLHGEERLAKKSKIEVVDELMQDTIVAAPVGAASSSGPSGSGDMETDVHEMRSALFSLGVQASSCDVGELFSPGRLQELCAVVGLTPGGTFDLRTGWDFSDEEVQRKCWEVIQKMKPMFVLGSPKFAPSVQLQNIVEGTPEFREMYLKGQRPLNFVMEVYAWQASEGRLLLHEHLWTSKSWSWPAVQKVIGIEGVEVRRGYQCGFGPRLRDESGGKLARRPTGWMSNAPRVLDRVALACTNDFVGGASPSTSTWRPLGARRAVQNAIRRSFSWLCLKA